MFAILLHAATYDKYVEIESKYYLIPELFIVL